MPVYNGDTFIETAIESILNQTFTDFELLSSMMAQRTIQMALSNNLMIHE
jgi:hypothetical protein